MYARLVIGDFMMVMAVLSVLEQRQRFRGIAHYLGCVGRSGPPQSLASFEKQKLFLRGRHWRRPSPANSRADTTKFRKRLNTWNVEKMKAQFTCLVISEIPHQY